jgi:hypothetical protein
MSDSCSDLYTTYLHLIFFAKKICFCQTFSLKNNLHYLEMNNSCSIMWTISHDYNERKINQSKILWKMQFIKRRLICLKSPNSASHIHLRRNIGRSYNDILQTIYDSNPRSRKIIKKKCNAKNPNDSIGISSFFDAP